MLQVSSERKCVSRYSANRICFEFMKEHRCSEAACSADVRAGSKATRVILLMIVI